MKGHIYRRQRPDGSLSNWYAVIDLPKNADGKRRQRSTTHRSRREAQTWLARTIQETSAGEDYDSKITVDQYLNEWLSGRQSLRPSTRLSYQGHVSKYLIPNLGHYKLVDLRAHNIEEMHRQIVIDNQHRARPVGPATVRRIHATLMSALTVAVRRGLVRRNPAISVDLAKSAKTRPELWTVEQISTFLDLIRDDRLHALYALLTFRGLRRGEAVGLRWQDINFENHELNVVQQVVDVDGELVIGPPKTESGSRTIALDQGTTQLLRLHRSKQNLERLQAGPQWSDQGFVFTQPNGDVVNPAYVTRHFQRLAARHGLPPMRLHDLRHLSATLGLASRESLKEVSDRLGHSSIAITADIYAQVTTETARSSAERLAQHLEGGGKTETSMG